MTSPPANRPAIRRTAGAAQGYALVLLASLPTMAIVSLVPNLPKLFEQFGRWPHAAWLVPMVLTIPSLCIALVSALVGAAADRWGRRPILIGSLLLFALVGTLPAFAGDLHTLLLSRFPVGVAEAGIISVQTALLGDYFGGRERERWLGRMSLINPIAAALLVLAGGLLGSVSWRAPFLLYLLGLPLLVWTLACLFEPDSKQEDPSVLVAPRGQFPWRSVALVGLVTLAISTLYYVQAVQLGRVFGEHGINSPARIGLFVTMASLGVVVGGWAYPRLARIAVPRQFALVLMSYAIGYAGLGLAGSATGSLPAALVAQFGNGMAIPVMIGWSLQQFDARHRGTGMGAWAACFFAGTFVSPPLVTVIQAAAGSFLAAVLWTGILSGLAALAVMAAWLKSTGRPRNP